MTPHAEYIQDITQLRDDAISDLEELLVFAKRLLSSASFNHYIKAKTVIRYNTFSALYQRADAVLALIKANQGNTANIIIRSMWETLAEYDFINLSASNLHLDIRLAAESKQQLSNWRAIQSLRLTYPKADTWRATITDVALSATITRRLNELRKFSQKHPNTSLDSYKTLLSRLKEIDDYRISKNPKYQTLTQFDYRTVYSILSEDTHSTVLGNLNNSRLDPKASLEVRLDAPRYEAVRAAHTAYALLLSFLRDFNRVQSLKKGSDLLAFRATDKGHDVRYKALQDKYGF